MTTPTSMLEFSAQAGRWRVSQPRHVEPVSLSVVTQNVWFEPVHETVRAKALVELLADHEADVICLQEVTPQCLTAIQDAEWVRDEALLAVSSSVYGGYGCVVLSRVPVSRAWELELHSIMARSLLVVELGGFAIGTVHLESTRALAGTRTAQLEAIFEVLRPFESVVLTGDFNFDPEDPEEASLDPSFVDVWPCLRSDPGYTEDTSRNTMRLKRTGRNKHVRYDRILLRSRTWKPRRIELFADAPIGNDVFVSDHFGVAASFERG